MNFYNYKHKKRNNIYIRCPKDKKKILLIKYEIDINKLFQVTVYGGL